MKDHGRDLYYVILYRQKKIIETAKGSSVLFTTPLLQNKLC